MKFNQELIDRLRNARHIVVFTGAGVSKESGIATFHDRSNGLWGKYDVKALSTANSFKNDPALVWGWYEWLRAQVMGAQPNSAHRAIAQMTRHVPRLTVTVITQNVDDLHERSDSTDVLHLHGSLFSPRCFACKRAHTLPPGIPAGVNDTTHIAPPTCARCGGWVHPDAVCRGLSCGSSTQGCCSKGRLCHSNQPDVYVAELSDSSKFAGKSRRIFASFV